jgi:hypothetical protein
MSGYVKDAAAGDYSYQVEVVGSLPAAAQGAHYWEQTTEFDSTHFQPGSLMSGTISGHDRAGAWFSCTWWAKVYNKAYIACHSLRPLGLFAGTLVSDLQQYALAMNHDCEATTSDTAQQTLAAIPKSTVFYMRTHANDSELDSCITHGDGHSAATGDIESADVTTAAAGRTAGGAAACYFVHLDACNAAGDVDPLNTTPSAVKAGTKYYFSDAFGVTTKSGNPPDQTETGHQDSAMLSFVTEIYLTDNFAWTEYVWSCLMGGATLAEALHDASCELWSPTGPAYPDSHAGQFIPVDVPPVIIGDGRMKMHGVYLGRGQQWYYMNSEQYY